MSQRIRVGPVLVGVFACMALFGPWLAPHDPARIDLRHELNPPSAAHWMGTADNGIDVLSAILCGAQSSAVIAVCTVGLSLLFGGALGVFAGYKGGRLDQLITAFSDLVQAFPSIVLNIAILALVARPGRIHLVLSLSVTGWVLFARLARAQALVLRDAEYVQAAIALGASEARVLWRHVVPNLLPALVVQASGALGGAVLAESTLSFLGLGASDTVSWGQLLDQGSAVLLRFPHVALFSGATIALTALGFQLSGDYLRDKLDPKDR
jgi:peptide/nickel transport system permease protein